MNSAGSGHAKRLADAINNRRRSVIHKISTYLDCLKHEFLSGAGSCNQVCKSIQLGTLIQKLYDLKLLDADVDQPLQDGISLSVFVQRVREIEPPNWHGNTGCRSSHDQKVSWDCSCRNLHNCSKTPSNIARKIMLGVKTGQASEVVFGRKTPLPPTSGGRVSEGGLLGIPAATTTTATAASEEVGRSSFSETAESILGEASVEKLFKKPLARRSSVLKESVQYFVLGAELEMEGLELSSYV